METQNKSSNKGEILKTDVHRASCAKHLKSEETFENYTNYASRGYDYTRLVISRVQ